MKLIYNIVSLTLYMLEYLQKELIMRNFTNKYIISLILLALTTLLIIKYNQSSQVLQQTTIFPGKIIPLNYTNSTLLNTFNKKNIDEYQTAAGTYDIQTIASEVTSTMLTAFKNTPKRTLPLVANWNVGIPEYSDGLDPLYIINRFTYGEHLIPTWKLDPYYNDSIGLSYYEASIKKAAELGLPLVFILPSPESALTKDNVYFSMDKIQNPNVITVNGTVLPKLSPFGPDSLWNEVGEQWSSTSLMAQLQEWYPNPPLVVFIDEDNSKKLSWSKLPTSSRYISQYPTNTSNEFKRTLVNAKWLEKYRQLHEGFKQGLIKSAWKQNVKFITRNQLASNMGVTADWINSATTTNQYANIWPFTANGLTINFNLDGDKTDTVNTPHSLLNNLPFMLEEAKELNPNFTYQLSIDANQKIDNPQRYRGFTQFALWFLRPSIIRQKTNKTTREEINPLFQQVVDSVELIHNSDVLSDFWKNGKLVSTGPSRYNQNIPTNYQSIPREFLLKTNTSKSVWAFALEKGIAPNRKWLLFIQSPEENLSNVTVTIPSFDNIKINSTQNGNFFILDENNSNNIEHVITKEDISTINFTHNETILTGKTYYIDAINGNDTYDGLSKITAWKSLKQVNSHQYKPGDHILFKRNNQWYGILKLQNQHGVKNNPIRISSYGVGEYPIINSFQETTLNFNKYDTNIWKTTNIKNKISRLTLNKLEVMKTYDKTELGEKIPDQVIWYQDPNTKELYIYSTQQLSNIPIGYSQFSNSLFLFKSSNIFIEELQFNGGNEASIRIVDSLNIHINNIIAGNLSPTAVVIYNTKNLIIDNSVFDPHFTFNYEDSPQYKLASARGTSNGINILESDSNITISHNYFKNWGHGCVLFQANEGFEQNNIIFNDNYMAPSDITYGAGRMNIYGNVYNVKIYNNKWDHIATGNQINGHDIHIYNNIIDTVKSSPIKSYADIGFGFAISGQNILLENNIIANTDSEAIRIDGDKAKDNIIKDNIFYNNGVTMDGIAIGIRPNSGGWKKLISPSFVNNQFIRNTIYSHSINQVKHYSAVNSNGEDLNLNMPYQEFLGKYSYTPSDKTDKKLLKSTEEITLETLISTK